MDTSRQLIRWSIPGAVLIMVLVLDEFMLALITKREVAGAVVGHQLDSGIAVLLIALGVPLGFLMNQIYYLLWDGMATWSPWFPVPLDRGRNVLTRLDPEHLAVVDKRGLTVDLSERAIFNSDKRIWKVGPRGRFELVENTREGRRAYRLARRTNWRAVRWLMLYAVDKDDSEILRGEYGGRAETYHALGGSRYAVLTATLVAFTYNAAVHADAIPSGWVDALAAGLAWSVLGFGAALVLWRARANTLQAMQDVLVDGLRSTIKLPLHQRWLPSETVQLSDLRRWAGFGDTPSTGATS